MSVQAADRIEKAPRPVLTADAVAAGFRAVFRIFEAWDVSPRDALVLLGQPARSTFYKWQHGQIGSPPADTVRRISYLLGIYKAVELLFTDTRQADRWVREPNRAFGGQSALQRMLGGDVADLAAVRAYLDGARAPW
jgi:hypothetical protein